MIKGLIKSNSDSFCMKEYNTVYDACCEMGEYINSYYSMIHNAWIQMIDNDITQYDYQELIEEIDNAIYDIDEKIEEFGLSYELEDNRIMYMQLMKPYNDFKSAYYEHLIIKHYHLKNAKKKGGEK